MDDTKVAEEFDRRAANQPNLNAVLDAHQSEHVRRSNVLRDYVSRKAVLRAVRATRTDVILDLGCGVGRLSFPLARRAGRIIGVDVSGNMIAAARMQLARQPGAAVEFLHVTGTAVPVPDASVDKAFTCWVLAHMSDERLEATIADVHRCLKRGGRFFVFEQVRPAAAEFGEIHRQRSSEDYVAMFATQGYRFLHRKAVIRSPSYALSLWNRLRWLPTAALPVLDAVERLTVERKLHTADYVTVAFAFEKP